MSTEAAEVKKWPAGGLEPMDFGKPLPEPPSHMSFFGPGMVLVALGVGLGELFMWPRQTSAGCSSWVCCPRSLP